MSVFRYPATDQNTYTPAAPAVLCKEDSAQLDRIENAVTLGPAQQAVIAAAKVWAKTILDKANHTTAVMDLLNAVNSLGS